MRLNVKYDAKKNTVRVGSDTFLFDSWLSLLSGCVKIHREFMALGKDRITEELYRNLYAADKFLWRNGVSVECFESDIDELVEIIEKLKLPKDSPLVSTTCVVCGSKIWGRKSVMTRIGGKCRAK